MSTYDTIPEKNAYVYLAGLEEHIQFVREACRQIGGIPLRAQMIHDQSKFSPEEFPFYVSKFTKPVGDRSPTPGFPSAWLHHIQHNPHHWEHHIFPVGLKNPPRPRVLEMPEANIREMIADWMGASRAYTGSWDIVPWLQRNWATIELHPSTRRRVVEILESLGFANGILESLGQANGIAGAGGNAPPAGTTLGK